MNMSTSIQSADSFQGLMQTLVSIRDSGTDTASNLWTNDSGFYYPWIKSFGACDHNDNMETAFKIVKVLLDKKLIKVDSVKEFIELIDIIKKEL